MTYLLTNCRVYTGDALLTEHDVLVQGTTITAVIPRPQRPSQVAQVDGQGLSVCPGLVDLQLYGGGESAFGMVPSMPALRQLRQHTLRFGTAAAPSAGRDAGWPAGPAPGAARSSGCRARRRAARRDAKI